MNLVKPDMQFMTLVRELCNKFKSILIFDEVMTGFRVSLKGAGDILGIKPDLTILGKIIGGGMPLAAFGGKREIMEYLAPLGPVYQAGTLSGNPIAVTSGLATLELIQAQDFYANLTSFTQALTTGLTKIANEHGVPFCADYIGGMFGIYFCSKVPTNYNEAKQNSFILFKKFFSKMLKQGIYFAPSPYEAGFICAKHSLPIIEEVLFNAKMVIKDLSQDLD
jgi:glutamate-1-semialdehyde 2,1-aminomutase